MTDGVWALDLLPVVARERPAGKRGAPDTWTDAMLARLVELREVHRKEWGEIGRLLERPLKSCHRRYAAIVAARAPIEPKPLSAAPAKPRRFHEEMGIRTCVVWKHSPNVTNPDRMVPITLSAGIACGVKP